MSGKMKKFLIVVIVCAVLVTLGFIGYKYLMICDIVINGNEYYDDDTVAGLASVPIDTHIFTADLEQFKQNIESDPHIKVNDIYFEFPNTLIIDVSEELPVAFCSQNGNIFSLSESLKILSSGEQDSLDGCIEIDGLDVLSVVPGQTAESSNPYKISAVSALLEEIDNQDMGTTVQKIDVTDVNNIILYTDDGHKVLFGDGDEYESKFNWLKTMVAILKNENSVQCTIDVSSGDFATIQ